jgi:hypothetical protein
MHRPICLAIATALSAVPLPAEALCYYHGTIYAKTTLRQEFRDAQWVVRARVLSAANWQTREERGTAYRLALLHAFKGKLPSQFNFSTERNSGGFYLEGPNGETGGDYLLFLTTPPSHSAYPPQAQRSTWVNYSCGQSKPWREVTAEQRHALTALTD